MCLHFLTPLVHLYLFNITINEFQNNFQPFNLLHFFLYCKLIVYLANISLTQYL